jgi:hypothetical protein
VGVASQTPLPPPPYTTALYNLFPPTKERKVKLREAQAEVKKEIEAYRAMREQRLRTPQAGAAALDVRVAQVTAEVDQAIAGLEAEYQANRAKLLNLLTSVRGPVLVFLSFFPYLSPFPPALDTNLLTSSPSLSRPRLFPAGYYDGREPILRQVAFGRPDPF